MPLAVSVFSSRKVPEALVIVPAVIAALFEGILQKSGDPTAALQVLGISWGLALCLAAFLAFLEERKAARG